MQMEIWYNNKFHVEKHTTLQNNIINGGHFVYPGFINLALMKKYFWNLLIYFIGSSAFGQTFITLDSETNEFIDNVNFSIYNDGQLIKRGVTLSDQPTTIK